MIIDKFEKVIAQLKSIEFFIACVSNEENEDALNNIQLMLERTRKDLFKIYNEIEKEGLNE